MKNICVLFLFMTLIMSCKTKEKVSVVEETKTPIMKPVKAEAEVKKEGPRDLNDLIKQLALTESEKEVFLGYYKEAGLEISNMVTLNLSKQEERKRRKTIYRTRDNSIRSILDKDQVAIYNRYLWSLSRRRKINQSQGTEINN